MTPALNPGEEVLVDIRAYRQSPPRPGEIVVLSHPEKPGLKLIKRIDRIAPDGRYFLRGDNATESTDSRMFGPVPRGEIIGRVTCRFFRDSRRV